MQLQNCENKSSSPTGTAVLPVPAPGCSHTASTCRLWLSQAKSSESGGDGGLWRLPRHFPENDALPGQGLGGCGSRSRQRSGAVLPPVTAPPPNPRLQRGLGFSPLSTLTSAFCIFIMSWYRLSSQSTPRITKGENI